MNNAIHHPFDTIPSEGEAVEVADGVLWLRLPLPMALDHVNCYALADPDGWTLIDTGMNTKRSIAIWQALLAGPLAGKPIVRVLVTHYHPDHIGLAGWFQSQGAELLTTRTTWLYARMLTLDQQQVPCAQSLAFYRQAGAPEALIAQKATSRPFNFCDTVAPLPLGYKQIVQGDRLLMAGRRWRVEIGHGHAPCHATLWSEDCSLVLGGDQLLPGISANIGVYPSEPMADPLSDWLDSTARFATFARDTDLVLPGHKTPFTGLPFRLVQMAENHYAALDRLLGHLSQKRTAIECFVPLFKRELTDADMGMGLVEAVAHLNYLLKRDKVSRFLSDEGAWMWQAR